MKTAIFLLIILGISLFIFSLVQRDRDDKKKS